jgi:MinD superfamily P-loop ATPase
MIISIASGKGGTGKTTIAVNLALSLPKGTVQLIDCDVEEPNSHLFLNPFIHQVTSVGIPVPRIDETNALIVANVLRSVNIMRSLSF